MNMESVKKLACDWTKSAGEVTDLIAECERLKAENAELINRPKPRMFFTTEHEIKMARCGAHGAMYYEQGKDMIAFMEVKQP